MLIILNLLSIFMEKINILFIALAISVIIFSAYIAYLKAKTDFLLWLANNQRDKINAILEVVEKDLALHNKQTNINDSFIKHMADDSVHRTFPTGGRRSEAEA